MDGKPVGGTWRAHQVPLDQVGDNPEHLAQLEAWLRSYRPEELFDEHGRPTPQLLACIPDGQRRIGANPHRPVTTGAGPFGPAAGTGCGAGSQDRNPAPRLPVALLAATRSRT
ncbi:hypothetical protein OG535_05815 [Kitasatospora sp. NBC_00085]|uniref:hypothetical protein n=1 Tax=unclassified Kitasatospora TaxID=2633591 RepID=UPI0032480D51